MKKLKRAELHKPNSGFSLVELLVAMAITIIVLGAALMMFVKSTDTNDMTTQMAEAQANARAAANLISQDLSQAGTGIPWGGITLPSGGTSVPEVFATDTSGATYLAPNQFYTNAATGTRTMYGVTPDRSGGPALGAQTMDGINIVYADPILSSTDTRISNWPLVTMASTPGPGQGTIGTTGGVTTITFPAGGMTPPVTDPNTGLQVGDVLLLSNGTGQAVGTVTAVAPPNTVQLAAGDAFVLNQTGFSGSVDSLGTTAGGNTTYTGINVVRLYVVSYFLQPLGPANNPLPLPGTGAVDYRLMRQVNSLAPTIVSEHIDFLQFYYDLADSTCAPTIALSHIPDAVEPACGSNPAGPAYANIRTVYIRLAARSARPDRRNQYSHVTINTSIGPRSLSFNNTYPPPPS